MKKSIKQNSESGKIQCHFISNTHWDREWRYSAQRTRYNLVYLMDMLMDILEKETNYQSFHLDSQTVPIQDYLEIRPEMEEKVSKYVSEKRLFIGPWFCLPDEFCVGGESLIRNLLLGHKIAEKYGYVSKTGYSPFSWGQISQMPQLYKGFGIDAIFFYRGVNSLVAPKSEFFWEGPDGSRIVGSRLGKRPRYNVSCVVQRAVYWGLNDVEDRDVAWGTGNGLFRFIDKEKSEMDLQYMGAKYGYHKNYIDNRAKQAIEEQNDDWSTPHRLWSTGHDSSCPDIREVQMIDDCDEALGDTADVFHSNFEALQKGIIENARDTWPLLTGEMRHPYTKGSSSALFGMILSARMDIKIENFKTERALTYYAEPMAVFASLLGAPYPQAFIDLSYNYMLQNHGHDSIGGCSRDIVSDDVLSRCIQSREISSCVMERAAMDISSSIDFSKWSRDDMAIVVFNPASFKRSQVISTIIEIPNAWDCDSFKVIDNEGEEVNIQVFEKISNHNHIIYSPNDITCNLPCSRYETTIEFNNIPSMGYKTFKVVPVKNSRFAQPFTMLIGPQTMENEHICVSINSNGTLTVFDKKTKQNYKQLGYFRDSSEIGNPWEHQVPPHESVYTTLNEKAEICLIRDGELEASFRVTLNWMLPESRTMDERSRSKIMKLCKIVNTVTLRKGQPWVEIITEVDNTVEDHYLQVSFPTGIKSNKLKAQGQFDVVERSLEKLDYSLYDEKPQTEHPMNSFVDISDNKLGVALLNEGLKGYEAHGDMESTISMTLLRAFPLRICVTYDMTDYSHIDKGSQCLGKHTFRYAFMPHSGNYEDENIWQMAERFNLQLHAVQIEPTFNGTQPLTKSFLEVGDSKLHVSAVKRNEKGDGWIVRLFNPLNKPIISDIRLNGGRAEITEKQSSIERIQAGFALPISHNEMWSNVRLVTLEEKVINDLSINQSGWVGFEIQPKQIFTIEFLS